MNFKIFMYVCMYVAACPVQCPFLTVVRSAVANRIARNSGTAEPPAGDRVQENRP